MRRLALTAAVLGVLAAAASPAWGDADPASDVLLGENVFYPYNPPVAASLQRMLGAATTAAHRARFPLKVALIDTPVDLGAIPTFFGKPRQYAAFLDQEISFGARLPLLVVMPDGYGTAGVSAAAGAAVASLPNPPGRTSDALAEAAIRAVSRLAAAAGHPIAGSGSGTAPGRTAQGGSGGTVAVPLAILAGVCVALAAAILAVRRRRHGGR